MPLIEQLAPFIYSIPTERAVMHLVRAGVPELKQQDSDRDDREIVEDERWGRLGTLFEEGLSKITESVKNRQKSSGMIYPKETWQPGDREWLEEQATKMGLRVQIGPRGEQMGWHSDMPWITFNWFDHYFKAQFELGDLLKAQRKYLR